MEQETKELTTFLNERYPSRFSHIDAKEFPDNFDGSALGLNRMMFNEEQGLIVAREFTVMPDAVSVDDNLEDPFTTGKRPDDGIAPENIIIILNQAIQLKNQLTQLGWRTNDDGGLVFDGLMTVIARKRTTMKTIEGDLDNVRILTAKLLVPGEVNKQE